MQLVPRMPCVVLLDGPEAQTFGGFMVRNTESYAGSVDTIWIVAEPDRTALSVIDTR
jgi:hypothetical protein